MGSWSDKLVNATNEEDGIVVDNIHLGSAIALMKSDGVDEVEASALDFILSKAMKKPMTLGALKRANSDLAETYLAEIWR